MPDNREALAEALRERLAASGMSQNGLARKIGISPSAMSDALAGNARAGLTPVARAIARQWPELLPLLISIDEPSGSTRNTNG